MKEISEEAKRWQEFIDWISQRSSHFAFRGISNKEHLLISGIGRKDKISDYCFAKELFLFNQFKLKTNLLVNAKNDLELLTIAQHHSLPTRLLDWTENPLVACFFAIQNKDYDGRIYAFNYKKAVKADVNKNPFSIQDISVFFPPITSTRLNLQRGLFTIHPNPQKPCLITPQNLPFNYGTKLIEADELYDFIENFDIRDKSYYNNPPKKNKDESYEGYQKRYYSLLDYIVFDIKKEHKTYFEKQIRLLGIDETIYGDIDSISQKLMYEVNNSNIRKQFEIDNIQDIRDSISYKLKRDTKYYFSKIKNEYSLIRSNFYLEYINQNNKSLNFNGQFEVLPNYFNETFGLIEIDDEKAQIIKKFQLLFSKIIKPSDSEWYFDNEPFRRFSFNLTYNLYEKKPHIVDFSIDDFELDFIKTLYLMINTTKEKLNKEEINIINDFDLKFDSIIYERFVNEIVESNKLNKISEIYNKYKQNK